MATPTPIRGLGPSSRQDDAARRILAARLSDVRYPEARLRDGLGVEDVHDMRVATRRLRAALQVFGELAGLARLEKRVKRLQDALGAVRDLHVQRAWLEEVARHEGRRASAGLRSLRARREAQLSGEEPRLRKALGRWAERTVPALLAELGRVRARRAYGGRQARKHLHWRLARLDKRLARYGRAPDAAAAHELRKEVKKLRYELEIFQPAFRRTLDAFLEVLLPLQECLGALHDADVRLALLEGIAAGGKPAEREAARRLLSTQREERASHAAEVARELERWRAERLTRRLERLLR